MQLPDFRIFLNRLEFYNAENFFKWFPSPVIIGFLPRGKWWIMRITGYYYRYLKSDLWYRFQQCFMIFYRFSIQFCIFLSKTFWRMDIFEKWILLKNGNLWKVDIFEKWTFSIEKTNDNKNLHGENVQLRLQELNRRQDKGIKRV